MQLSQKSQNIIIYIVHCSMTCNYISDQEHYHVASYIYGQKSFPRRKCTLISPFLVVKVCLRIFVLC
jgi:hypothetical protein